MVLENGSNTKTSLKANYLKITYSDTNKKQNDLEVFYKLRNHTVVNKWAERLLTAQKTYSIDNPRRFYGFGSLEQQLHNYQIELENCIATINQVEKIIVKPICFPISQNNLNYLHHIFEIYHGLLDSQTHEFYVKSSDQVKQALANLNILVHKGESIIRGSKPRHVVTYFGLPKTKKLALRDYEFFTDKYEFGTVYINYVEIGKTLEDLAIDNDQYIQDSAFKPFKFYSADFAVLFYDSDSASIDKKRYLMNEFYNQNKNFFLQRQLSINHPYLKPGKIPVADIDSHGKELLQLLESRQYVKSVQLV